MPDNIPETGDVVIHSSGHTRRRRSPSVRFPDRTSSVAKLAGRRNGWRDPVPSDRESICGFLMARVASRCWLASVEQHIVDPANAVTRWRAL